MFVHDVTAFLAKTNPEKHACIGGESAKFNISKAADCMQSYIQYLLRRESSLMVVASYLYTGLPGTRKDLLNRTIDRGKIDVLLLSRYRSNW